MSRWERFKDWWSLRPRSATVVLVVLLVAVITLSLVLALRTPSTSPPPPTKAEVEAWLPEGWYLGISWDLMLSRVNEKFSPGIARAEFHNGAKFMVVTVEEGDFFVAPPNEGDFELLPWPPS